VVKSLKERFGYVDVVMIGDGATDMQVGREGGRKEGRREGEGREGKGGREGGEGRGFET